MLIDFYNFLWNVFIFSPAIIAGWLSGWIAAVIKFPLQVVISVLFAHLYIFGRDETLAVNELPFINFLFNLPMVGAAAAYTAITFVG